MHGEAPELKRCCFCLPLRRGLIGWGYTKLILNILAIVYSGFIMYIYATRSWRPMEVRDFVIVAFIDFFILLDIAFGIIFIVAGHKKNVKLLQISYIYNMAWLVLVTLANCFQLCINLSIAYRMWSYMDSRKYIIFNLLTSSGLAFSLIFAQIYLILLIRSEMIKLRQQTLGMQYSNVASGEPQCTLHSTSDQHTDGENFVQNCCTDKTPGVEHCCTDKEQVVQNCCTKEKCNT
ncbi:uncharacterized protein LOC134796936 [Cydia splendana]|uniref:uncharacterized protein LOC134796936 n=1 Tax=Cydia splendana TaxID=1100963 RepID=UPI00300C9AB2